MTEENQRRDEIVCDQFLPACLPLVSFAWPYFIKMSPFLWSSFQQIH